MLLMMLVVGMHIAMYLVYYTLFIYTEQLIALTFIALFRLTI